MPRRSIGKSRRGRNSQSSSICLLWLSRTSFGPLIPRSIMLKESIPMIVGVTAEDGIRVAVQAPERAAFQANQVKQINGVKVELEITVVTEHLQGNRRDDL